MGFVVFPGCGENDIKLPYAENWGQRHAIALDHARLRAALQNAAEALPHVTMLKGGRVVGVEDSHSQVRVAVQQGTRVRTVTCELVVAADGASSSVRTLAGIAHQRRPMSTITGYLIGDRNLPAPGFGHVFIGAAAPLLSMKLAGRGRAFYSISRSGSPPLRQAGIAVTSWRRCVRSACVPRSKPLWRRSAACDS